MTEKGERGRERGGSLKREKSERDKERKSEVGKEIEWKRDRVR